MGSSDPNLDAVDYLAAIGHFATGVTVVTSTGENGPSGCTASAVCSLSLDPLLMLVCLDRGSRTLAAIRSSGLVGINVLSNRQRELALKFAGKAPEAEKFEGVGWTDRRGVPLLDGVVSFLAGEIQDLLPGGDHLIGVASVTGAEAPGGEPLVYHRGGFGSLAGANLT